MLRAQALWSRVCAALGLAVQTSIRQLAGWMRQGSVRLTGLALAPLFRECRRDLQQGSLDTSQVESAAGGPDQTPSGEPGCRDDFSSELVQAAALLRLKVDNLLQLALPATEPAADSLPPAGLPAGLEEADEGEAGGEAGFDPARWRARLEQAEQIRRLAAGLGERYSQEQVCLPRGQPEPIVARRLFVQPLGRLNVADLAQAWRKVQRRLQPPADPPIFRSETSWRSLVPRLVHTLRRQGQLLLQSWTRSLGRPEQVAAFLAFLELVRRGRAKGVQPAPTEPIRVVWVASGGVKENAAGTPSAPPAQLGRS